jgi:signal transduction histidine kinase
MYAFADISRRWAIDRLGLGDVSARLLAPVTGRPAPGAAATDARALAPDARLRIATVIALSMGVIFLPLEARTARTEVLFSLLLLYGVHTLLSSSILIASHTPWGARYADRLAVVLVVAHAINLHVYLLLWPAQPGLVGGILACLLMGSTVLFSWSAPRVLVLAGLVVGSFALLGEYAVPAGVDRAPFTVASLVLAVAGATAVGSARVLGLLRTRLAERQDELTALSGRLMSVQEEEHRRLARELHDEFGQTLTAVNSHLWLIERQGPSDPAALRARTADARRLVSRTLASMRELSQLLRPSVLDDLGLIPSLEGHLETFQDRHGIATSLSAEGLPARLPPDVETAFYRIVQEALTNVARHARATRARVALTAIGSELRLEIEDDGVGLPPAAARRRGTGLIGIRERTLALGGSLVLEGTSGARIVVRVPHPRVAA